MSTRVIAFVLIVCICATNAAPYKEENSIETSSTVRVNREKRRTRRNIIHTEYNHDLNSLPRGYVCELDENKEKNGYLMETLCSSTRRVDVQEGRFPRDITHIECNQASVSRPHGYVCHQLVGTIEVLYEGEDEPEKIDLNLSCVLLPKGSSPGDLKNKGTLD